jgi:endonuclease/exonuclease/phosphatase (EEP) superfamily protein YafD
VLWNKTLAIVALGLLMLLVALAVGSSVFGYSYIPERLSNFQLQYWVGAMVLLLVLVFCQRKTFIWAGLFGIALISVNLLTWYAPVNTTAKPWLKVLSSNIWIHNQNYPSVVELVRKENPDIAMFFEVTPAGQKQLDTLYDILPFSAGRDTGAIIYTKINLHDTTIWDRNPQLPNTTIIENLQHQNHIFTLVATHPSSPHPKSNFLQRNQQLANLSEFLASTPQPVVMGGDFNISMWSPYYRQFVEKSRVTNAREGFGIIPTWSLARVRSLPTFLQSWLSVPIDYIFTRSGKFTMRTTSMKAGPGIGSDHLPIIAEIGVAN